MPHLLLLYALVYFYYHATFKKRHYLEINKRKLFFLRIWSEYSVLLAQQPANIVFFFGYCFDSLLFGLTTLREF